MKYTRDFLGTELSLSSSEDISSELLSECYLKIEEFEKKYSRFIEGNYLDNLNIQKRAPLTKELKTLVELANKTSEHTKWYYDISILPFLENAGYGIKKEKLSEIYWYKNIEITESEIILHNNISIEFWSLWKWYLIDILYVILDKKLWDFIINFWGDIRVKWKKKILLEDPYDNKKSIGEIEVKNFAIASSSWIKRKFWEKHHIINPFTGESKNEITSLFVTHKLATFADMYATALFVSPLEIWIHLLEKIEWLEALIICQNGKVIQTKKFNYNPHILWLKM